MGFAAGALDRIGNVTSDRLSGPSSRGRARVAALRGGVGYAAAAVPANVVVKPLVYRGRPAGSEQARIGPLTSSFPSGHAATDLAFVFGVSQALPVAFLPPSVCTVAGGALGIGVAIAVGALWPDDNARGGDRNGPELTTTLDGADAGLLVHIEPVDGAPSDRA